MVTLESVTSVGGEVEVLGVEALGGRGQGEVHPVGGVMSSTALES